MSESVAAFQTQLVSNMDILVQAVVCETTKLFEAGVQQLRTEVTKLQQENETLKLRLQISEALKESLEMLLKDQEAHTHPSEISPLGVVTRRQDVTLKEEVHVEGLVPFKQEDFESEYHVTELSLIPCEGNEVDEKQQTITEILLPGDDVEDEPSLTSTQVADASTSEKVHISASGPGDMRLKRRGVCNKSRIKRRVQYSSVTEEGAIPMPVNSARHRNHGYISLEEATIAPTCMELRLDNINNKESCEEHIPKSEMAPNRLASNSAFEVHRDHHILEKSFPCGVCGKTFLSQRGRNRHSTVHGGQGHKVTDVTLHVCQYCDKSFTYKSTLTAHIRMHTGETPYRCQICGREFRHRRPLRMHLLGHSGETRHVCPYCGKRFLDLGNFKRHKRIHTGEKPYSCQQCGRKFTQSSHLKKHLVTHSK